MSLLEIIKKIWSMDLFVYFIMALIGVFTWYIAFKNESSKTGRILASAGITLFVLLFVVLFIWRITSSYAANFG